MDIIKQFQRENELLADGIIGKKTLQKLKDVLQITSNESLAHFVGQTCHESAHFTLDTENLMYSVAGLLKVFKKYFKTLDEAEKFAKQPERIANKVYANRMGNGDENSGDGFKFRGRGAIQLTGKNNYQLFSNYLGVDVVKNPDLVASKYFFESAKFFFDNNKLWKLTTKVDDASITAITKKVNGGSIGLTERIELTKQYYQLINK
jgi:putative chitinase